MTLDLRDCTFFGSALPEPFVRFDLHTHLARLGLLHHVEGKSFERNWEAVRRQLVTVGGAQRICNHVIAPLAERLRFNRPVRQDDVATHEGSEDGGWLMQSRCGARLRAWTCAGDTDLDAPARSGRAYRFSPTRCAQRVLLANGERVGLLTNGNELRVLLCDPVHSDSHIGIPLAGGDGWRASSLAPDSYRLLLALAAPEGIAALPDVLDAARLSQTRVTKDLRLQARTAIEGFLQAVLEHPTNAIGRALPINADALWQEGLVLMYRLLFILKLESAADPARAFSFASTHIWRHTLSPNRALGPLVRRFLDKGHDTGTLLEDGLRLVFRVFRDGLSCSELSIAPLGGALFGDHTTPLLDRLAWGERAVALLLDHLLWTSPKGRARERVHYGSLDVEELGRVYEALLELEPGIARSPMTRLRRAKLEVVVPTAQAARYRHAGADGEGTRVMCIEDIKPGRFFLRVGFGRKATGSYYTPHAFVRFLVRASLAPQITQRSRDGDPDPSAILTLKVLDPATGSGHFLVEACRYLGEALYAACRMCDELATAAEAAAAQASDGCPELLARAAVLRRRVTDLPDPDGLLLAYLPSRATEGGESGISQSRALAICRRLVAVHCLYGVDSNRLAIELAKVSLWLESYAEGLPLTFLDHRLVHGDSVVGPFFTSMMTLPVGGGELDPLLARGVHQELGRVLRVALRDVQSLKATVGSNAADLALKSAAKCRLDAALQPLRLLARAWSGAVALGTRDADDEWLALACEIAATGTWPGTLTTRQVAMLAAGDQALPWDLTFPDVFWSGSGPSIAGGFDAVLSNPPWDILQPSSAEFLAGFDLSILDASGRQEAHAIQQRLLSDPAVANAWRDHQEIFARQHRLIDRTYSHQRFGAQGAVMGGKLDLYRVFAERMLRLAGPSGAIGMVVPSAFHANEGATGIRLLYLEATRLETCLSFENRKKLFDIDGRFKFALIVARRPGPTRTVRCAFYLTELEQSHAPGRLMEYGRDFIEMSGGAHATFLELRHSADVALAKQMFVERQRFGEWIDGLGIALSRELHMTDDAHSFRLVSTIVGAGSRDLHRAGYLPLHEGKTIHQFSDQRETVPRYVVSTQSLARKPQTADSVRYFRAACRDIAGATNERTVIATILPPRVLCGHTISVERKPARRPNSAALTLVAVMNSFAFDWLVRQKAAAHVSLYILADLPVPALSDDAARFLAHGCLRLCCNHRGFAPLWREQLGGACPAWPAIADAAARWQLRAAMDVVVALAYGLDRAQYKRVLSSFSHKSSPAAPGLCLAAFDERVRKGGAAFYAKHDPHFGVPLVTTAATPVIEHPVSPETQRGLYQATG
jgi:hypothetical protein